MTGASSEDARQALGQEVDRLAEAVATIRLVVGNADLVQEVEAFEAHAKRLEDDDGVNAREPLLLTPLIETLREYEKSRP